MKWMDSKKGTLSIPIHVHQMKSRMANSPTIGLIIERASLVLWMMETL